MAWVNIVAGQKETREPLFEGLGCLAARWLQFIIGQPNKRGGDMQRKRWGEKVFYFLPTS
jgi:hypothetical protein